MHCDLLEAWGAAVAKKTGWSYSYGKRGYRVRVFERKDRDGIWVKYTDRITGKPVQRSLGHDDRVRAKQECRELSESLAAAPAVPAESAAPSESSSRPLHLTFERLFELYENECSKGKKGSQPAEDLRRKKIWLHFFKTQSIRLPEQLDEHQIQVFIRLRRHGDLQVPEVELPAPAPRARAGESRPAVVKDRTIDADLVYLNTILNWATKKRKEGGRYVLEQKPVHVPRLRTKNPYRPVASHDDLRPLLRVADLVDPQELFGCFVRLHNNLGWRVSGTCYIRGCDIDLRRTRFNPYGRIRKNELVDKQDVGGWVPMSRHTRAVVLRIFARTWISAGENRFLFEAPRRHGRPWSRFHVRTLMRRAEKQARIAHIGGEHAWRRKWFSERKDYPLADLMKAGGHADPETVRIYQQADPETTFDVVTRPTRRIRRDR